MQTPTGTPTTTTGPAQRPWRWVVLSADHAEPPSDHQALTWGVAESEQRAWSALLTEARTVLHDANIGTGVWLRVGDAAVTIGWSYLQRGTDPAELDAAIEQLHHERTATAPTSPDATDTPTRRPRGAAASQRPAPADASRSISATPLGQPPRSSAIVRSLRRALACSAPRCHPHPMRTWRTWQELRRRGSHLSFWAVARGWL